MYEILKGIRKVGEARYSHSVLGVAYYDIFLTSWFLDDYQSFENSLKLVRVGCAANIELFFNERSYGKVEIVECIT